jgi:hypothetical protein
VAADWEARAADVTGRRRAGRPQDGPMVQNKNQHLLLSRIERYDSPMATNPFGYPPLSSLLKIKRSVFVSYHHSGDRGWYDAFARYFSETYDVIEDNSVERQIDSDALNT